MRSLTLLMCVFATPALAEDFFLTQGRGVSFAEHALVEQASADVWVERNAVYARHGLRREKGREQFASATVISIGDVLLVKDAAGNTQRMRFASAKNQTAHLVWLDEPQRVGQRKGGEYVNTSARTYGVEVDKRFGRLMLGEDGRFSLQGVRGQWTAFEGRLALSTYDALWGYPEITRGGDVITFRFTRNQLDWELVFERKNDEVASRE